MAKRHHSSHHESKHHSKHHMKHHDPKHHSSEHDERHHSMHHSMGGNPNRPLYEYGSNQGYREGYYEGPASRRDQEMNDAGMIRENHAAIANLPQEVMIKPWPSAGSYLPEGLDDTIRGVNHQEAMDDGMRSKHNVPKKV